jgi:nucleoid-associated protein YgaU
MGNFEKLSVLVIVVIIVMILVVALYTWTDSPADATQAQAGPSTGTSDIASILQEPVPAPRVEVKPAAAPVPLVPAPVTPLAAEAAKPLEASPSAVTPAAPVEKAEPREHVIASGDTLEKISKQYYGSTRHIAEIERANPELDPMRLRVGRKILLPDVKGAAGAAISTDGLEKIASRDRSLSPGGTYTVRRGDSLPEIARRTYGKIDRWHEIWLANYERIEDPDRLTTGTRLSLPK